MSQEEWFFVRDGAVDGPISASEVAGRVRQRAFGHETLLWREGMTGWTPLSKTDFGGLIEPGQRGDSAQPTPTVPSLLNLVETCLRWPGERLKGFRRRWSWRAAIGLVQGAVLLALASYVLLTLLPVARRSRALRDDLGAIAARATVTSDPSLRSYVVAALSRQGLRAEECEIEMERGPGAFTLRLRYVEEPALFGLKIVLHREETVKSPTFESLQELR